MRATLAEILCGAAMALGLLAGVVFGIDSCHRKQGSASEVQSAVHQGEAQTHAQAAISIPNHAPELAEAQADVDRARAEVARLRKLLAAKPSVPIPDPVGPGASDLPPASVDHRDEVIAAQVVLIEAQDGQIKTLKVALTDEQGRSEQFRLAYEAERKATAAQQVATKAWKDAVTTSRWSGRFEGAVAGALLGYLGAKR